MKGSWWKGKMRFNAITEVLRRGIPGREKIVGYFLYPMMFLSFIVGLIFSQDGLFASPTSSTPGEFTNSIGMEFVLIPAGSFLMGADKSREEEATREEMPQHRVTISKAFYMGKYEVTQEQWVAVMGKNPSRFENPKNPVESVSWPDVQEFIDRLNAREGGKHYRLPTEAEWEYAVRAGTTTKYFFGDDKELLAQYGWYAKNSGNRTHPVGQLKPNPWGLYDVYGNVWEWLQDLYDENYYQYSPDIDPPGPSEGINRAVRGGGWNVIARFCRSANRDWYAPDNRLGRLGFRLVRTME